ISRSHIIGESSDWIVSFFERVQDVGAQFESFRIRRASRIAVTIKKSDLRVEVTTVVIKRTFGGQGIVQRLDVVEFHVFDMHEADNYVRYLNTGVVNVVLNFHPFTSSL